MRETFEKAILDDPDEKAGYAAYGDWLQEQGDPRGEFIAVQLALEDETRSPVDRMKLKIRERELLNAHERPWLGELAPYLLDGNEDESFAYRWRSGFLSAVPGLSFRFAQVLAISPAARFMRELRVGEPGEARTDDPPPRVATPPGVRHHNALIELIGSACLRNLRLLQVGDQEPPEDGWCDCHCYVQGLEGVVAGMPRIEELHLLCKEYDLRRLVALPNLTRLRVLRVLHLDQERGRREDQSYGYPLDALAQNPAFGNLTHLLFHPHFADESYLPLHQVRALLQSKHLKQLTHLQLRLSDMGDEGIREIIASGILKQLRWLDLRHGEVTDVGARFFAECPDTRNLERLDLSRNAVTIAGLNVLRAAGIAAVANNPLSEEELTNREYLHEGDFE